MRGELRGGRCGRWRATAAHAACSGGLDYRLGAGHGEERTQNMKAMVVTLEVSKLSGWLNADAYCRASNGGHTVRCAVQSTARRRATAVHATCKGGLDCRSAAGLGEERTKNMERMSVTLEVSKLSG